MMLDVVFVAALVALTALAALLIAGCDKLIGPDAQALAEGDRDDVSRDHAEQARRAGA